MTDAGSLVGTAEYYEVVWPLDRRDYLTVENYPLVNAEPPAPAITPITVANQAAGDGRRLAAKALLRGAHCPRKRIIELLRISKWTLERIAQRKTVADTPDPKVLEMAHACLEESSSRGSTPEERAAALAWLRTPTLASADTVKSCTPEDPPVVVLPAPEAAIPEKRNTTIASADSSASPSSPRRLRVSSSPAPATTTPAARAPTHGGGGGLSVEQMDALTTQQQRILRRSTVIDCVLRAEDLDAMTMRQAVRDLLEDIAAATHTIGTIVQQAARFESS
jgi:hypothetical protein